MKKILFVAFVALMAVSMSSCKKNVSLPGTTWTGSGMQTMTLDGDNVTVSVNSTLNFTDETNGTMKVDFTLKEGEYIESGSASGNFTYTFDDNQGTLKGTLIDTDGESVPINTLMIYDVDSKTLVITFEGIELTFLQK